MKKVVLSLQNPDKQKHQYLVGDFNKPDTIQKIMESHKNYNDLNLFDSISELRTGDLAIKDKNEIFFITGRKSRFIKVYGYRINLDYIEEKIPLGTAGSLFYLKDIKNQTFFCARTISVKFNDPTHNNTVMITNPIDTS